MLISSCSKDENNTRNGHVIEMLKQLCVMCPSEYLSVRQMCVRKIYLFELLSFTQQL